MNTKTLVVIITSAIAYIALGGDATKQPSKLEKAYNEKFGGQIERPTALKGVIGFVDCASGIDETEIVRVRDTIAKEMKFIYRIVRSAARNELPTRADVDKAGLSVAVFIVSNPTLPPMLVAPEERWALVNIQRLKDGLPDNTVGARLFASRCRGEIMRAFAVVCGSWSSLYQGNILTASSITELDSSNPDKMIFDMVQRCTKYLASIGVTPSQKVTYKRAVQEGWAPAPTNDVQKVIWDEVHAMPTEPIKIKPETTKQK